MSSGRLKLKGTTDSDGVRSQYGSTGEICLSDSTIPWGGGFSESMSSVARLINTSLRGPVASSTPTKSTEIRANAKALLWRTRSGSPIVIRTAPSIFPPPTNNAATRSNFKVILWCLENGQSTISVVVKSRLNVLGRIRRASLEHTG